MATVSIATFAFLLVVAMATANPVHTEEKLTSQDPIKAIKYFWNEEIRKDRSAQVTNLWNEEAKIEIPGNMYYVVLIVILAAHFFAWFVSPFFPSML